MLSIVFANDEMMFSEHDLNEGDAALKERRQQRQRAYPPHPNMFKKSNSPQTDF
jgi:hypothetical protein